MRFSLIIKDESPINEREQNVTRWLEERLYNRDFDSIRIHAKLTHETVVILSAPQYIARLLNEWFVADIGTEPPYPNGALLHWRYMAAGENVGLAG
jgi:hypothetical protein